MRLAGALRPAREAPGEWRVHGLPLYPQAPALCPADWVHLGWIALVTHQQGIMQDHDRTLLRLAIGASHGDAFHTHLFNPSIPPGLELAGTAVGTWS